LFDDFKRQTIIEAEFNILLQKIQNFSLKTEDYESLMKELRVLDKLIKKKKFIAKRVQVDKGIITNILNKNIEELEAKNKIIAEQIAFKERLLANVNHELRTPLNAIIGMSSLLQQTELTDAQREYIDIIKRSGDNLFIIINDFLTISSIEAGKLTLKRNPFNLREIFKDLYNIFVTKTQEKGIDLRLTTSFNLPDMFIGDATRIYQIFQNLLTNAIKFTTKGYVLLNASVKKDMGEFKILEFLIEDTGIGIPQGEQDTIFNAFTQAHTAGNRDYMGTGLGLNIVKTLVDLMGGEIYLESKENQGTKFIVTIPLREATNISSATLIEEAEILIPESWKTKKFLMIEDNAANIVYARELFKKWNLDMTFCETYTSGLKTAKETYFDLILSDLKLPDGNGINLLKEIRADENAACQDTCLAVITASILQSDKNQAKELNISSYIEKPFIPKKLLSELYLILEKRYPQKERIILSNSNTVLQHKGDAILLQLQNISKDTKVQLEFIDIFLTQLEQCLIDMDDGIKTKNYQVLYLSSHTIKSTIRIFDLKEMSNQVMSLEKYSDEEELTLLKEVYIAFRKNIEEKIPTLKILKKQLEAKVPNTVF